jgi:Protein of unknown function (DUF3592)
MTTDLPAIDRGATGVTFWATATVLAAPLVLSATWALSSAFGLMKGTAFVGDALTPLQGFVVGCYFTGPFAAIFYCWGKWNIALGHASKAWPTASAIVTSSDVAERDIYRRGICYRLEVEYDYKVKDFKYKCDRLQFGNTWLDDENFVRNLAKKYHRGAKVAVHYNPSDPSSAVLDISEELVSKLEGDYRGKAYLLAAMPVIFFVGIWLHDLFHDGI